MGPQNHLSQFLGLQNIGKGGCLAVADNYFEQKKKKYSSTVDTYLKFFDMINELPIKQSVS